MPDLTSLHESLGQVVLAGRDRSQVFTEIAVITRRSLPGCDATSITLIRGEKAFTAAHDGQLAVDADELQYKRGHGPCLDAGRAGQVLLVDDMRTEHRWPDYARKASAVGVGSALSIPLPFQTATIGAVNLYARRPSAFSANEILSAKEIAGWVAFAVGNADTAARTEEMLANMRIAMLSRAVIDQAKGVLIERFKVTEEQAFTMLSKASQSTNVKLRDIADELVHTGELRGGDSLAVTRTCHEPPASTEPDVEVRPAARAVAPADWSRIS